MMVVDQKIKREYPRRIRYSLEVDTKPRIEITTTSDYDNDDSLPPVIDNSKKKLNKHDKIMPVFIQMKADITNQTKAETMYIHNMQNVAAIYFVAEEFAA